MTSRHPQEMSFIKMWFHNLISNYTFQYPVKPLHPSFSFTTTISSPLKRYNRRSLSASPTMLCNKPKPIKMITSKDVLDVTYRMVVVCPRMWDTKEKILQTSNGYWTPLNVFIPQGSKSWLSVSWNQLHDSSLSSHSSHSSQDERVLLQLEISLDNIAHRILSYYKENHFSLLDILVDFLKTRAPIAPTACDISTSPLTFELFQEFLKLIQNTKLTEQEIFTSFLQVCIFHSRL